jgi:predicted membrane protein
VRQRPTRDRSRLDPGSLTVGIVLVALGVLFLLDQTGSIDAGNLIGDWWPIVIVIIGLVQLAERPRSPVGPLIVMGVGGVLLLMQLDLISREIWNYLWPILLVVVGVVILLRLPGRTMPSGAADDVVRASALFGSNEVVVTSQRLQGGSATAIFGGVTLDLRQATLDPGGATVEATAIFGEVEVLVPRGWRVDVSGTPIFAGLSNKAEAAATDEAPMLEVAATSIFAGVEIKHNT